MPLNAIALAAQIETDFRAVWVEKRPTDPPIGGSGAEQRQVLFLAIARGVLNYLEAQQNQMFNTIRLRQSGVSTAYDYTVVSLDLNKAP